MDVAERVGFGGSSGATIGSGNSAGPTTFVPGTHLYVRRAFVYLGGNWGALHFGQDDGSISLMDAGVTTFQTYTPGGMNDDFAPNLANFPPFPFISAIGNDYTTSKVVYLSPRIAGFDASAEFEPDDNPLNDAINGATPFSPQLSTGTLAGEVARRRNTRPAQLALRSVPSGGRSAARLAGRT